MKLTRRSTLGTTALAVGNALREHGIDAVLTGGACAHLYTDGRYSSVDLDFVLRGVVERSDVDRALAMVGFERRRDHYVHARCRFFVEFPRGPLAIGGDTDIEPVVRRQGHLAVRVLSATDSCRDRLAAFYHWNDRQALRVAVWIALRHRVRMRAIEAWSATEGAESQFAEFRAELQRARQRRRRARR